MAVIRSFILYGMFLVGIAVGAMYIWNLPEATEIKVLGGYFTRWEALLIWLTAIPISILNLHNYDKTPSFPQRLVVIGILLALAYIALTHKEEFMALPERIRWLLFIGWISQFLFIVTARHGGWT